MRVPCSHPFSYSVYPMDAPKKAPEIADSTVMMARIITPQMFLVGTFCDSSNIAITILFC